MDQKLNSSYVYIRMYKKFFILSMHILIRKARLPWSFTYSPCLLEL